MANLYITSAETFSGKSAMCVGVGMRMRSDGFKTGYMKPVNIGCPLCDGLARDEDVIFAKEVFDMPESIELIGPVALTPAKYEQLLRGSEVDYGSRLMEAYNKISAGRDMMVFEGGRSLREGYIAGLPPKKVVDMLNAEVLLALKYDDVLMVDRALTALDYFDGRMSSLVVNEVPRNRLEFVQDAIVPFLTHKGINVLGVLRIDPLLKAPTVGEIAEGLNAEILCCADKLGELVEDLLIGAMSAESALSYFRRKPNKAVLTGGDRTDILMAALETSTRCLILTGNLYPNPQVINRSEELGVPVLLAAADTSSAVDTVSGFFGRSRFQQPQKLERFEALLNQYVDFPALYAKLGVKVS